MLSQIKDCTFIMSILSVVLIIGIGSLVSLPAYAEERPAEGLPNQRVGGGTRVSEF